MDQIREFQNRPTPTGPQQSSGERKFPTDYPGTPPPVPPASHRSTGAVPETSVDTPPVPLSGTLPEKIPCKLGDSRDFLPETQGFLRTRRGRVRTTEDTVEKSGFINMTNKFLSSDTVKETSSQSQRLKKVHRTCLTKNLHPSSTKNA